MKKKLFVGIGKLESKLYKTNQKNIINEINMQTSSSKT